VPMSFRHYITLLQLQ